MRDENKDRATPLPSVGVLVLVFALPLLLLPPRGDDPIDDDFDYSATAFHLANTGELGLTDWPSMTLVAHVGWGAAFVRAFGESHEVLRFSTLVLAVLAAGALAVVAWRRSGDGDAIFFAIWFFLSPLTLALGYTFMTDLPAASVTMIGLAVCCIGRGIGSAVAVGVLGAWGLLIRQTGVLWAIAAAVVSPIASRGKKEGVVRAAIILTLVVAAWAAFRWWLANHGGLPWNAARWQLAFEPLTDPKLLVTKGLCLALGIGLYVAPAVLWSAVPSDLLRGRFLAAAGIVAVLLVGGRKHLRVHEGTELRDLALGNGARIQGEDALRGPMIGDVSVFETTVFGLGVIGLFVGLAVALRPRSQDESNEVRIGRTIAKLTFCMTFALYLVVESWFDRYYLALMAPAGIWLATKPPAKSSTGFRSAGGLLVIVYAAFAILGVQDRQQRAEVVWRAAREMEASGVDPDQINACFEYAAIRTYLPLYWKDGAPARPFMTTLPKEEQPAERERRMPDRRIFLPSRKYTLSWRPLPGQVVEKEIEWWSWWRNGTLFVLRKR